MLLGTSFPTSRPRALPARDRRHLDHRLDHRHLLRAHRPRRLDHERALQERDRRHGAVRDRLHPGHAGVRPRRLQLQRPLLLGDHRPRRHVPARRDHRVLHGLALEPGQGDREGLADGPRDEHHRGPRDRDARDRAAGGRDRRRDPRRAPLRRPLRHRRRRDGAALDDRPDRRARRLRPGHRQRRRDRRDGAPARVGARDHRPARRGRQHDEGGHEGLRDRLGRARRARPLRQLHEGPRRPGARDPVQPLRRLGDRGALHRRPDAVPVRLARDDRGRARRRRGRGRGAPPVPRAPRDHGGHRAARLRDHGQHRHRAARSRTCWCPR